MSLGITDQHHSASLMMPINVLRDRFVYPHHTPMRETYNLAHWIRMSACFTWGAFDLPESESGFEIMILIHRFI